MDCSWIVGTSLNLDSKNSTKWGSQRVSHKMASTNKHNLSQGQTLRIKWDVGLTHSGSNSENFLIPRSSLQDLDLFKPEHREAFLRRTRIERGKLFLGSGSKWFALKQGDLLYGKQPRRPKNLGGEPLSAGTRGTFSFGTLIVLDLIFSGSTFDRNRKKGRWKGVSTVCRCCCLWQLEVLHRRAFELRRLEANRIVSM